MLIVEYAAFPGNIARAGDAVSDPQGRWRCAQIRANQSPQPEFPRTGKFSGYFASLGHHRTKLEAWRARWDAKSGRERCRPCRI